MVWRETSCFRLIACFGQLRGETLWATAGNRYVAAQARTLWRTVQPLRDRGGDRRLDVRPVEQHLLVVEAEDGVSTQYQLRIAADVTPPLHGLAVVLESVELHDEPLADKYVDGSAIEHDLLSTSDTHASYAVDDMCLEPRICEHGCRSQPQHRR